MAGVITTQARAAQLEGCHCGTERLPTLVQCGRRPVVVQYVCEACRHASGSGLDAERAAVKWNADVARRA